MDDIGSTDDTALLCHTNKPAARLIVGDWFDPNGKKVGNDSDRKPGDVPGFKRNRSPHVVRLKRSSDGTPPEGTYKCVGRDTTGTDQTVYVGIYFGMFLVFSKIYLAMSLLSSSMPTGESVTRTSSIFMPSEVNVAITSSTTEGTTSSHRTPTQTVVYGTSGEIKTSNTHFDYTSSAAPTQTVVHSTSEGLTQTFSTSSKVSSRPTTTPLYSISTSFKANPTPKYSPSLMKKHSVIAK